MMAEQKGAENTVKKIHTAHADTADCVAVVGFLETDVGDPFFTGWFGLTPILKRDF